jgi:hypothetical protein
MAQFETDREDLLAEATALVERAEFSFPETAEPVVIGFRRDGCGSIYFGADPAYHFNTRHELRRAYLGGLLYKAEQGRLVSLERRRTSAEVQLLRCDLNAPQTQTLLDELKQRLAQILAGLNVEQCLVIGHAPVGHDIVGRMRAWLKLLSSRPLKIAASPRAL